MSVAFALVPAFWCAPRPVIQAFVFFLLCVAPHPVLGFLTGPCPVGFVGRIHYTDAFVYHTAQRSCQQLSTDVGGKYRAAKNFMALASRVSPWGSSRKRQTSTGSQDLLVNHLNAPWEKDDTATHDTVTVLAAGYPGVPYGRSSALPL